MRRWAILGLLATATACGGSSGGTDGGVDAGSTDAGAGDAGTGDAGTGDAGMSGPPTCALGGRSYPQNTCTETLQCGGGRWGSRATNPMDCRRNGHPG